MSGSPPSLRELIDLEELQSIQDSFARAVGISSVILSPEGEPLTKFTNPTGFCSLIQSTEKGKARCFQSFMEMGKNALLSKEPEIYYCFAHGGHFVAPIMIDGEHKGTMFAGQFIPEKFSSEQLHDLETIAHEIDLAPGLLVKEAENLRVVGEDVVRNYSSLLFKIVETITRRGAQAAELGRVNDALQLAHDGLEKRVQERTAELAEANKGLEQEVAERKLAEGALQKEKDRAQHYLDIAGVMFLVIGADRKVSLINKKGYEILGYEEEEEIAGKDWFDNFVPKRLRDEVAGVFGSLIAGEIELVEYYENPVLTKHGEERIVAWHNTLLRDEHGRIYATMASGEDITERKKAEEALRESEEKYRNIYNNTQVGLYRSRLSDGKMLMVNNRMAEMFGYDSPEEVVADYVASKHYTDPTAREKLRDILCEHGKFTNFEALITKYDGSESWMQHSGTLIPEKGYFEGVATDITERKAAEEELKKRAGELEKFNKLAVGRELKMIELKKEINALLGESGKEPGYKIVGES